MLNTLFHWGIHAWAIYGIIGLSLAYFGFRYRLPVTVRSGFYPLPKHRIYSTPGTVIDILALCATIFGLTTTLGFGAMQLHAGLREIGAMPGASFQSLVFIILLSIGAAVLSSISGVGKGLRYLSQGNLILAISLMLFVLLTGPTVYILAAFTENIGYYLTHIVELSFRTFAYESTKEEWFTSWTIMYWAWWISWAPFVGLFIAKISRGHTIREFVVCVLLIPTVFNLLWMTVFGNGAIWMDAQTAGMLTQAAAETDRLLFLFLNQLPLPAITSLTAILVIAIFFITSADSGIFVINSIASQGKSTFPKWQSILWGSMLAILAIGLLYSGGLEALQTMTVIMALPFSLIMVVMAFCLLRGLWVDDSYFSRNLSKSTAYWDGKHWQARLKKVVSTGKLEDVRAFLRDVAEPAFEELKAEFAKNGIAAQIRSGEEDGLPYCELIVESGRLRDFLYGVGCKEHAVSKMAVSSSLLPNMDTVDDFEPVCYFADGRRGYSLKYMRREELLTDGLRQYERYIRMIANSKHNLYLFDKKNDET
ncbi:BCCT family transporter [uncultured Dialister sp.]|uniref:BCCT family transporter n=1 Tax=uncultured Dialister sp. TaxID=278064 RepID=UPI0027DBD332|nr:BCCT family transporter [uncultured Dialister sp.]